MRRLGGVARGVGSRPRAGLRELRRIDNLVVVDKRGDHPRLIVAARWGAELSARRSSLVVGSRLLRRGWTRGAVFLRSVETMVATGTRRRSERGRSPPGGWSR